MPYPYRRSILPVLTLLLVMACGGEPGGGDAAAQPEGTPAGALPEKIVTIARPAAGDTVAGPSVTVEMSVQGFALLPAGDSTPNSGHLHLFLDRDLSPAGIPIPTEPGFVIHIGTGAGEYTFESVAPGEHFLIAVVGDAVHVPLQPWVVDTVRFTVR
jgi:hypothetical protein